MMQMERERRNGINLGLGSSSSSSDHVILDLDSPPWREKMNRPLSSCGSANSINSVTSNGGYIEHHVSRMDTLAGVAIKYGVEVADIKKMNGLVTDLQMFALKTLQIPLPGRHPPSPIVSTDSATPGESSTEHTHSRRACFDVLESLQSLKFETPERKVSPAMSSLQGYYRLKAQNCTEDGTEMAVYSNGRAHYLEDRPLSAQSQLSDKTPSGHRKCRSLVKLCENGDLFEDVPVSDVGDGEAEKIKKSVRRRQKAETDTIIPSKEDNGGGSGFSVKTGKGLALRPKSTNRIAIAADADSSWLNPVAAGIGESLATSFFDGVRKSSSTSNLQDQESNGSSLWTQWSLKPDLQAFSAASLARPIFDGLPKPMSGRRSKAALD